MTQRKKRLGKLIEHRQHELDLRLSRLSETRAEEQQALARADEERSRHERAERERSDAVSRPVEVGSFVDHNLFLASCAKRRELAELDLTRARRAVQKAQVDVAAAKNDLKKIELLSERVLLEEQKRASVAEQRLSDEFSARRAAETQKRRSEP